MQFPTLKTGVAAQYPLQRSNLQNASVLRFLDGSEQRFADSAGILREWLIRLDLLDDDEVAKLEAFFLALNGRFGSFSFRDPADDAVYPNCSLKQDALAIRWSGEARASMTLVIRENRG